MYGLWLCNLSGYETHSVKAVISFWKLLSRDNILLSRGTPLCVCVCVYTHFYTVMLIHIEHMQELLNSSEGAGSA